MTVAVTKTKAEQALSHNFEAVPRSCRADAPWREARKAAIGAFAALGLPHRRIEEWKYTDLRSALKEALAPPCGDADQGAARRDRCGARKSSPTLDRLSHGVRRRPARARAFGRAWPAGLEVALAGVGADSGG